MVVLWRHGGDGGATAVLVRYHGGHGGATAVPRRSWRCHGDPTADWPNPRWPAEVLNMFKVSAVPRNVDRFPRCYGDHWRNHGDHGGARAVYAVQAPP